MKRIFLVASRSPDLTEILIRYIEKHIRNSTVFLAQDGAEALFKAENVFPHVAILDAALEKFNGFAVTDKLLQKKSDHKISIILLSSLPEEEHFIEQVLTGQVQFLSHVEIEQRLPAFLARALNCVSSEEDSSYSMRFLSSQEILFQEGEEAKSVFIVKSGELSASKMNGQESVKIGVIRAGEFVGEMAHINKDKRNATVQAITDCELIEIPSGAMDAVLFSKPLWAKALVATLSKRLKISNSLLMSKV